MLVEVNTKHAQALLETMARELGAPAYSPGGVDGVWGAKTQAAWEAFTDDVLDSPQYGKGLEGEGLTYNTDAPMSLGVLHWALWWTGLAPEDVDWDWPTNDDAFVVEQLDGWVKAYEAKGDPAPKPKNPAAKPPAKLAPPPGGKGTTKNTKGASSSSSSSSTGLLVVGGLAAAGVGVWALTRGRRGP